MILLAITLLAFLSAAPARALRYELRESAGLLFRNEDRSLRKIVGHENAEFAVKIPAFRELSSLANHTTCPDPLLTRVMQAIMTRKAVNIAVVSSHTTPVRHGTDNMRTRT